jgi:hypothetical protein
MTLLTILQVTDPGFFGREGGISAGALAFMLTSMGLVVALTIWCFARILRTKEHFDPDGTGPARTPVQGEKDTGGV